MICAQKMFDFSFFIPATSSGKKILLHPYIVENKRLQSERAVGFSCAGQYFATLLVAGIKKLKSNIF
jgi:hypothetical protein